MKKEITPLVLLISAVIVFGLVSFLGVLYNLWKSIHDIWKLKPIKAIKRFIIYWLKFIYQIWNVCKYYMEHTAIAIDLFGNVAAGEMIEDCVTRQEQTLYGLGNWTVSAATGREEYYNKLTKTGKWFSKVLSKVLGANHCINAYYSETK
jgi:hypothetical protein